MSVKDPAIVYLSYSNGKLVLTDNEDNGPSSSCDFSTDVASNGKIGWQKKDDSITSIDGIDVKTGADIFKQLPEKDKKTGSWEGKIDNKTSGQATYNIVYTPKGGSQQTFDPTLKVKAPTE